MAGSDATTTTHRDVWRCCRMAQSGALTPNTHAQVESPQMLNAPGPVRGRARQTGVIRTGGAGRLGSRAGRGLGGLGQTWRSTGGHRSLAG